MGSTSELVFYRPICENDKKELKELHEELFPIRYLDTFYDDAVKSKGLHGRDLFTSIAIVNDENGNEKLVGFILAQLITTNRCEDTGMFEGNEPQDVCYILTIGLRKSYRRGGHGRRLVEKCVEYASNSPTCGAVYLHVIHYNKSAVQFYEKIGFEFIKELSEFYSIDSAFHSSYLYALYVNGYTAPLAVRYWNSFRRSIVRNWTWSCHCRPLLQSVCRCVGIFGLSLDCPASVLSLCYFKKLHQKTGTSDPSSDSTANSTEEDYILKVL